MGILLLRCPTTGREFPSGICVEEDSFKGLLDTMSEASCPHCGASHRWWTHEARLGGRIEPSLWGAFGGAS